MSCVIHGELVFLLSPDFNQCVIMSCRLAGGSVWIIRVSAHTHSLNIQTDIPRERERERLADLGCWCWCWCVGWDVNTFFSSSGSIQFESEVYFPLFLCSISIHCCCHDVFFLKISV